MPLSMREQLQDQSGEVSPRHCFHNSPDHSLTPSGVALHPRQYLPRLVAVLYAVFDPVAGPTVVHQVPEGSVATRLSTFPTPSESSDRSKGITPVGTSRTTNLMVRSTSRQGLSSTQVLFDFSPIREFVIPKAELCGHLITKATRTSKILGFPVRYVNRRPRAQLSLNVRFTESSTRRSITKA